MDLPSYWQKPLASDFQNLLWNLPERKTKRILNLGGNQQNFATVIKNSEFLATNFPFETVTTLLPDALKAQLPPLPNLLFAPSTESGSFAPSNTTAAPLTSLASAVASSDITLLSGDFSKNSATAIALTQTLRNHPEHTFILTRDSIDLLNASAAEFINSPHLIIIASLSQLQKLFRALYYPKMILLSMPLLPVIEILHKFTLSYPCLILTFHDENIILAKDGQVFTVPISNTHYSPLSLWSGQLACRVAALSLWNPQNQLGAATAALFEG